MRNSKMKGFTLIELIVVIAIIGILAAILVPSMLGYVRNARISSANSGAKQIHTACASALTQLGIANWNFGTTTTADDEGDKAYMEIEIPSDRSSGIANGIIDVKWQGIGTGGSEPTDKDVDLAAYIGEEFTGFGRAYFNTGTYSVSVATYATTGQGITELKKLTTGGAAKAITEGDQKEHAKKGTIYGIYPAPALGKGTSSGSGAATPATPTE